MPSLKKIRLGEHRITEKELAIRIINLLDKNTFARMIGHIRAHLDEEAAARGKARKALRTLHRGIV